MYNYGQGGFDLQALLTSIAIIVALAGVIFSVFFTYRGQKHNVQQSKAEADRAEVAQAAGEASALRAENASGLTIDVMERIADALDKVAGQGIRGDVLLAKALPERVTWSLATTGATSGL